MLNWATMFGAIGPQQGELIDYIPTWHHGLGMMRFLPHRAKKTAPTKGRGAVRRLQVPEPGLPVLQASAGRSVRPQQAAVRSPSQRGAARPDPQEPRRGGQEYELHGAAAQGGGRADQRRQGRPGQRARGAARRSGRASAAGADGAARHLLDESPAGTATGGRGTDEALIQGTGFTAEDADDQPVCVRARRRLRST